MHPRVNLTTLTESDNSTYSFNIPHNITLSNNQYYTMTKPNSLSPCNNLSENCTSLRPPQFPPSYLYKPIATYHFTPYLTTMKLTLLFASLSLAAPQRNPNQRLTHSSLNNYVWPQSDYTYQLSGHRDNHRYDLTTDGRNMYLGTGNVNGAPLHQVNVFIDVNGDVNIDGSHHGHNFVSVDKNRLVPSTRANRNLNLQRGNNYQTTDLRYSNQNQFLACPVDSYGNAYDLHYDQNAQDHIHQVYVDSAPCANPIAVNVNGNLNQGYSRYQDSRMRVVGNRFTDSNVYQNDGRLMLIDNRQNNNYQPWNGQISYRGQLVNNQGQFVQLGNQASMRFTDRNNVRQGLTGFQYRNNRLTYQNQGFIACQTANGMWDLRPTGAEGAAQACNNAQYVEISMEPLH